MCMITKKDDIHTSTAITSTTKQRLTKMTRNEVSEQADPNTLCLLIIGNHIYDCTSWQKKHPGGHLTVRALSGKDATDSFTGTHPSWVRPLLNNFVYAELDPEENLFNINAEDKMTGDTKIANNPPGARYDEATIAFRLLTKKMENAGFKRGVGNAVVFYHSG